jgi:hypothetical protein
LAHSEEKWREAKRLCRLNNEDIARAKRLGLNPKSLIKNIPQKTELWKAPVKEWLINIEEKSLRKSQAKKKRKETLTPQTGQNNPAKPQKPQAPRGY